MSGANSYRGVKTFIKVHRQKLNKAFKIGWKSPRAHTSIRFILQGLKAEDVEKAFREHAANLNRGETVSRVRALALDGKVLKRRWSVHIQRTDNEVSVDENAIEAKVAAFLTNPAWPSICAIAINIETEP